MDAFTALDAAAASCSYPLTRAKWSNENTFVPTADVALGQSGRSRKRDAQSARDLKK